MDARTVWHAIFLTLTAALCGMSIALMVQYIGWNNALHNISDEYNDLAVDVANLDCTASGDTNAQRDNTTCYMEFRRLKKPSELQIYIAEVAGTFYASLSSVRSDSMYFLGVFSLLCVVAQNVLLIFPERGLHTGEVAIYTAFSVVSIALTVIGMLQWWSICTTMLSFSLARGSTLDELFFPISIWNGCEHIVNGCRIRTTYTDFSIWYDNTLAAIRTLSSIQYGMVRLIIVYSVALICCMSVPVGLLWWRHKNQMVFHQTARVDNDENVRLVPSETRVELSDAAARANTVQRFATPSGSTERKRP